MSEISDLYKIVGIKAKKIVGPKAKLPEPPGSLDKSTEAASDLENDFSKNAEAINTATQEFVNIIVKLQSESRKYNAAIQKADFGLDLKDPEKLKKVTALRKYYQSNFDSLSNGWEQTLDKLEARLDAIKAETKKMK